MIPHAEEERDSRGDSEPEPQSPWPGWLSKDDVVTIAIALGVSYGIRWHVAALCTCVYSPAHAVLLRSPQSKALRTSGQRVRGHLATSRAVRSVTVFRRLRDTSVACGQ